MKTLSNISILLCILLLCTPPDAKTQEVSQWLDLGLYGGQFQTVAVDPSDSSILFAGSYLGGGLFKSADYGATWKTVPGFRDTEVYEIAFDRLHQGTLWIAHNQYISASQDYGETWQVFNFAEQESRFCYSVIVDPHDRTGKTVYAGTGGPDGADESGAVFKTINGGRSWFKTRLTAASDVLKLAINPARPGELWAASSIMLGIPEGKIYATTNSAVSWRCWDIGWYLDELLINPQYPLTIYAAGENGVLRKQDGPDRNTGWEMLEPRTRCRSLAIPAENPETLYAGLDFETAKSTDRGTSWSYYPSQNRFLALTVDPAHQTTLYGGDTNRGLFKSTDAALSWNEINAGIQANQIYSIDFSPAAANVILSGTLGGIYLRDESSQWQLINAGHSEAVAFHPTQDSTLYAGFYQELGKSADRGLTWSYCPVSAYPEAHDVSCIAVSPHNPDLVLAGLYFYSGERGELIKSTDAGETFDLLWSAPVPVNDVAIHPINPQILFAGTGSFYAPVIPGGLFRSSDDGESWTATELQNVVVNSIAISSSDPNLMFAGCGGSDCTFAGIYKSTDAGATWALANKGLPQEFAITSIKIDKANNNIIYAASFYGGIYVTLDGGNYWTLAGLSDYLVYDVKQAKSLSDNLSSNTASALQESTLPSTIVAGTTSGIYQYASSGTGILTGIITSKADNATINGADVFAAACGNSCIAMDGYYLLLLPAGVHTIEIRAPGYETTTVSNIQVMAGQSVIHDVALAPYTGDASCPATALLSGTPYQNGLPVLRKFRDHVLSKTDQGRSAIMLYYASGDMIWKVLEGHPGLKARCLQLTISLLPIINSSVNGSLLPIPERLLHDGLCFLRDLERAAPEPLKKQLHQLRRDFDKQMI